MLYTTKYSSKTINIFKILFRICLLLFVISSFTVWASYQYFHGPLYIQEVIDNNIPPSPEPKIKHEIRYVEKQNAIPTWKFIQHLNGRFNESTAKVIAEAVDRSHEKYGLPKKLIIAIMKKESDLNPLARSKNSKGEVLARGLMQVFAKWHIEKMKGITLEQLYHVDINIDIGCQIFRDYYDESDGDLTETFHKYLSKKASKADAKKYMDEILKWWATLEMYEYNKDSNPKSKELEEESTEEKH